jgi:hypothetical protein
MDSDDGDPDLFRLLPSPAGNGLIVELPGQFELELYDSSGTLLVFQQPSDSWLISTKNLPSGKYYLDITASDGLRATKQFFVKQ